MSTQETHNHGSNSSTPLSPNGTITYISGITRGTSVEKRVTAKGETSFARSHSATSKATSNFRASPTSKDTNKTKPHHVDALSLEVTCDEVSEKTQSQETLSQKNIPKSSSISVADVREELMLLISELEELIEYNE